MPSSVERDSPNKISKNVDIKSVEKPPKSIWIASGELGSREAVLVFRTNILIPTRAESSISSECSNDVIEEAQDAKSNDDDELENENDSSTDIHSSSHTTTTSATSVVSLKSKLLIQNPKSFKIAKPTSVHAAASRKARDALYMSRQGRPDVNVLSSLPKNQRRGSCDSNQVENEPSELRQTQQQQQQQQQQEEQEQQELQQNEQQPQQHKQKKHHRSLYNSHSSSDTSISSVCDDPAQTEEDIEISSKLLTNEQENSNDRNKNCPTKDNNTNDDDDDDDDRVLFIDSKNSAGNGTDDDLRGTFMEPASFNVENSTGCMDIDVFENKENLTDFEEMPAKKLHVTYKFISTETRLLKKIFERHGLVEVKDGENFCILWTGIHMKPDTLRNLAPYQRVNHFPRSYELTRKDRLYKNIERMQHLRGFKQFDIVPESFLIPREYRDLTIAHNKYRGPWIVKPAASSRGRGIFIVNSPDLIQTDEQVLVSKYIADPLCIDGHKCDVRVYVLVTSFDPLLIYIYEEGIVRLATVKYDRNTENLWNPCMHLCNYSINKYHSDYIKSKDAEVEDVGHKWTLSALLRHLKSQGCDTHQLMSKIEDVIIKSILACSQSIISACRMFVPSGNNCFELYGFDILIDDTLKPWLLEVNLSPSMGIDSPLDTKVKASLVTDLLTCVGVPAYSQLMRDYYDNNWTRYRGNTRRSNSAERNSQHALALKRLSPNALTMEEQRIIRNCKLQHARRGGFVRIFPAQDSMQRYGHFLDAATGIPVSTTPTQGQPVYLTVLPHNYNQMIFNHLYGKESKARGTKEHNSMKERMHQYERILDNSIPNSLGRKKVDVKCVVEGKRLRLQILKLIETGNELTQLQARKSFSQYLELVMNRIIQEPRTYHEKLILKFITRVGIKIPALFNNPYSSQVINKDRLAMIAKLLGEYLDQYNRDTESYVDTFDHFGMVPINLFNEFLTQAQESDLESILTLHTNLTMSMPFLYNRCAPWAPQTPPIPTGAYGFLRALPAMAANAGNPRDSYKIENYYKNANVNRNSNPSTSTTSTTSTKKATVAAGSTNNRFSLRR